MDSFDYQDHTQPPRKVSALVWNVLTVIVLLVAACVTMAFFSLFFNPYSAFNPFPPPTLPARAEMPTITPTPRGVLPPTWTPGPTAVPTLTSYPAPDFDAFPHRDAFQPVHAHLHAGRVPHAEQHALQRRCRQPGGDLLGHLSSGSGLQLDGCGGSGAGCERRAGLHRRGHPAQRGLLEVSSSISPA